MKEIILIKDGELSLKGLNRSTFEDKMISSIKRRLKPLGEFRIRKAQSTIYIEPLNDSFDFEEALERVSLIFGLAAFSRALVCEKNLGVKNNFFTLPIIDFILHCFPKQTPLPQKNRHSRSQGLHHIRQR